MVLSHCILYKDREKELSGEAAREKSPEEMQIPHGRNENSPPRRAIKLPKNEMKLRKNEMKLRRNEMKVRRNWPFLPWRICISSGENPFNRRLSSTGSLILGARFGSDN